MGIPDHLTWILKNQHTGQETESESHSVVSNSLRPHGLYSHGILQARILEWVAFSLSTESSQPKDQTQVSRIEGKFFTRESYQGSPIKV